MVTVPAAWVMVGDEITLVPDIPAWRPVLEVRRAATNPRIVYIRLDFGDWISRDEDDDVQIRDTGEGY